MNDAFSVSSVLLLWRWRMEWFFQVCSLYPYLPIYISSWTDDDVWHCLSDPWLEDPAAGALLPSCPCSGNLLLVSCLTCHISYLFSENNKSKYFSLWSWIYTSTRILPESARWLLTQGKKKEAIKEICRAARVNGRKVPEDLIERVSNLKYSEAQ